MLRLRGQIRSWVLAVSSALLGLCLYFYDDWCEAIGVPVIQALLNDLEIVVMGPGLGLLAFLVSEQFRQRELRYRDHVAHEQESRFRFLGRIAASVAHEIRNPLHNVHLLCEELRTHIAPSGSNLVTRIQVNLDRLDQANLLIYELARPPCRVADQQPECADAVASVRSALSDLELDGRPLDRVLHDPPAGPLRVVCRIQALRISLHNLLRNAVEATEGEPVQVSYQTTDRHVELVIRNRGSFDPATLDGQGDRVASVKPGGLGVGVAISRHLLALYGATLSFECASGTVSTRIRLLKAS